MTTSKAAHTPGPWKVFTAPESHLIVGIGREDGDGICDAGFGIWRGLSDEAYANARLIAAAPDLLAALMAIIEFEAKPDFTIWPKRVDAARAAIAKATGA